MLSNFNKEPKILFELLEQYINIVSDDNMLELWAWICAQIIKKFGHSPIIDMCSDCNSKTSIYSFELQSGGLKCNKHAYKKHIKQSVEEIAQYIWLFKLPFNEYLIKSNKYILPTQEKILLEFMNNHMGIYI